MERLSIGLSVSDEKSVSGLIMSESLPHLISISSPGIYEGDCLSLIPKLPDASIDVVVTSPPYWGQRQSLGNGTENDPRDYLAFLQSVFVAILPKQMEWHRVAQLG